MAYKYLLNETPHCMGWCGSVMRYGGSSSMYEMLWLSDEVWLLILIVWDGVAQ